MERTICRRFVPAARWLISTPVGTRVEPDVYCRYAISSEFSSTGANVDSTVSGMASTAMMRGLFSRGIRRTNFCTASPTAVVVSTTAG
jgi:hypothetical protein